MVKVQILDSGILFNLKGKDIRTPCIIDIDQNDLDLLDSILKSKGAQKYYLINPSSIYKSDLYTLNYRKDLYDGRDYKFKELYSSLSKESIPTTLSTIDYTSEMSPIKNQGGLGSCVAFALTAVKEWQEQKEHDEEVAAGKTYLREEKYYDLSEQWLYYKTKQIDPWGEDVEGTSLRYALKIMQSIGIPCEEGWEYNDSVKGKPESWATMIAKWGLCGSYYRIYSADELIKALINYGPVPIAIYCFRDIFYVGKDGMIPVPENELNYIGGHAICCVGVINNDLFKIKNSWGTGWGQNGYGYLSREYIDKYMCDAWVVNDINVTRDMLKNK